MTPKAEGIARTHIKRCGPCCAAIVEQPTRSCQTADRFPKRRFAFESLHPACRCHSLRPARTRHDGRNYEQSVRFIRTYAVRYALSVSLAISTGLTKGINVNHDIGDHRIYRVFRYRNGVRTVSMHTSAVPDGVRSRRRPSQACHKLIKYLTRSITGTWMDVLICQVGKIEDLVL